MGSHRAGGGKAVEKRGVAGDEGASRSPSHTQGRPGLRRTRHWGWWGQESTRSPPAEAAGERALGHCVRAGAGKGLAASRTPNPGPEPWD